MHWGQLNEHDRINNMKDQHCVMTPTFSITTHYKSYNHTKALPTEANMRLTILLRSMYKCSTSMLLYTVSQPHTTLRLIKQSPQKPYQTLYITSKIKSIQNQHGLTYILTTHIMQYNNSSNIPYFTDRGMVIGYTNKIQIWTQGSLNIMNGIIRKEFQCLYTFVKYKI